MRRWAMSTDETEQTLATHLLSRDAETLDLDAIRRFWPAAWETRDDQYTIDLLVFALGKIVTGSVHAELVDAYEGCARSTARAHAVRSLEATSPDFASQQAGECLWDCEWMARTSAARTVRLDSARVRDRLAAMAADPAEDDEVRAAAARAGGR